MFENTLKLGELFKSSRKKGHEGLPLLSVTLNNGLVIRDSLDRRTETNLKADEHLLVEEGSIAYNMMRVWQGALGRADVKGLVSPAYVVLKPTKDVDSKFAEYLFKTPRMIYLFWAYSYGLTKDRLRLYYNDCARISVNLPLIKEQKRIAQILSAWDKAITTTEKLLAQSQQQKKALMRQLISMGKRNSGSDYDCIETTIGEISNLTAGGTPRTTVSEYWNGNIPWMNSGEINLRKIYAVEGRITKAGLANSSTKMIPKDSVLIALAGQGKTRGTVAINKIPLCINQSIAAIVLKCEIASVEYIYFNLESRYSELRAMSSGDGGRGGLNLSILRSIRITLPPLEEQRKITSVLVASDREIESIQQSLDSLKQEKIALMQQLLTGKRRVKIN